MIHGAHGGHGFFFGCLKARNLWGKSFLSIARAQEIYSITRETIIFKENPKQNALEFLAFGENFIMDRLTGSKS